VSTANDLGIILDGQLTMAIHVSSVCRAGFFYTSAAVSSPISDDQWRFYSHNTLGAGPRAPSGVEGAMISIYIVGGKTGGGQKVRRPGPGLEPPLLTTEATRASPGQAFITICRIDYCNSVLAGVPDVYL